MKIIDPLSHSIKQHAVMCINFKGNELVFDVGFISISFDYDSVPREHLYITVICCLFSFNVVKLWNASTSILAKVRKLLSCNSTNCRSNMSWQYIITV